MTNALSESNPYLKCTALITKGLINISKLRLFRIWVTCIEIANVKKICSIKNMHTKYICAFRWCYFTSSLSLRISSVSLWCVLITSAFPLARWDALSMRSGLSVPWAKYTSSGFRFISPITSFATYNRQQISELRFCSIPPLLFIISYIFSTGGQNFFC